MKFVAAFALAAFALFVADKAQAADLPNRYPTNGERVFVFSPQYNEWAAYDADGYKVSGGVANGGNNRTGHATPVGAHRTYDRLGPNHVSSKYPVEDGGGAPMPYAMHFTASGHAVHGSPDIYQHNTSHGCIRVKTSAAAWLNQHFMMPGTKVVVLPY